MIAVRLVHLIEAHCDEIADRVFKKVQGLSRTRDLQDVSSQELRQRTLEILRHLSEWLLCKAESEIENRYRRMGESRTAQGVSFADFCWSMIFTKEQIWNFVQQLRISSGFLEIYGQIKLLRGLDQFFERAICYGAEGYGTATEPTENGVSSLAEIANDSKRRVSW